MECTLGHGTIFMSIDNSSIKPLYIDIVQGAHYREKSGKTGNVVKKNSMQGKIREFGKMGKFREKSGNFTKTCRGNIREFSAIYIY